MHDAIALLRNRFLLNAAFAEKGAIRVRKQCGDRLERREKSPHAARARWRPRASSRASQIDSSYFVINNVRSR
jgi:hypothetical protein